MLAAGLVLSAFWCSANACARAFFIVASLTFVLLFFRAQLPPALTLTRRLPFFPLWSLIYFCYYSQNERPGLFAFFTQSLKIEVQSLLSRAFVPLFSAFNLFPECAQLLQSFSTLPQVLIIISPLLLSVGAMLAQRVFHCTHPSCVCSGVLLCSAFARCSLCPRGFGSQRW